MRRLIIEWISAKLYNSRHSGQSMADAFPTTQWSAVLWRRLRQALYALPPLESTRTDSRARTSMRLVAPLEPSTLPPDPLREAAREYVRAFNAYVAGWRSRFDGRRHSWRRQGFGLNFVVPLKLARDDYYERAVTSSDPLHGHVAMLLEENRHMGPYQNDGPLVRLLDNWLRDEPRVETQPAASWVEAIASRVELARARTTGSHTVTLSFELKQRLSQHAVLCVCVGTEVGSASASLMTRRKASGAEIDVIWKESRIWVMLDEPRVEEGDLVNITVSVAKPITRPATVRIATEPRDASTAAATVSQRLSR